MSSVDLDPSCWVLVSSKSDWRSELDAIFKSGLNSDRESPGSLEYVSMCGLDSVVSSGPGSGCGPLPCVSVFCDDVAPGCLVLVPSESIRTSDLGLFSRFKLNPNCRFLVSAGPHAGCKSPCSESSSWLSADVGPKFWICSRLCPPERLRF